VLALVGFDALLADRPGLSGSLQLLGGAFLIGLGIWGWKPSDGSDAPVPTASNAFVLGFVTNLTNPKVLIFFGTLFATVIPADATHAELVAVSVLLLTAEIAYFSSVAALASSTAVLAWLRGHQRGFARTASACFVALGVAACVSGILELWA